MPENTDQFPSTKTERGKIFAKTGLKVGANYARYLVNRTVARGDAETQKRDLNNRNAQDIYREFTKLRGTALKLAQSMSLETGVLPDEFAEVMTQAQYSVPPMNRVLVRRIIKSALGTYPEHLFASFGAEAIAAASIGQVHRATLKDGRDVAVKVQYPNVREMIKSDLTIAKGIFKRLVKGKNFNAYFDEVYEKLLEETDYVNEARNIDFFDRQYAHEQIVTPLSVLALTTENVLTMTFVEGDHMMPFLDQNPPQAEIDHFGQLLWDFVHEQIANNHKTIHADVHPGNFLFREDRKLGVIDFGCVKSFPQDFRDNFLRIFRARMTEDEAMLYDLYHDVDILDRDAKDPRQQAKIFDFFKRFGYLVLRPYHEGVFDFGTTDFKDDINALFKEASTFNEAVGSRHFIYVNKVLVGLFAVLFKLKPRIDTHYSLRLLNEAIDAIDVSESESRGV